MWHEIIGFLQNNLDIFAGGAFLGGIVGLLTGIFGTGGGFIITPALNIFLGVPMNVAVGTNACQGVGSAGFAMWRRFDRRMLGGKVALWVSCGILPGSYFGMLAVDTLTAMPPVKLAGRMVDIVNPALLGVFAVFLLAVAIFMLIDARRTPPDGVRVGVLQRFKIPPMLTLRTVPAGRFSGTLLIGVGLFIGLLSGMLGGGGVVLLPALVYMVGEDTGHVTQTTLMLAFFSSLCSALFHFPHHNINFVLAAALLSGSLPGAAIGASLQKFINGKSLRKYFACVVLVAWLLVAVKLVAALC